MTCDIELRGCAPVPLAHYLKALGVLRLVAEQVDPDAKGFWRGDTFVLRSKLDRGSLVRLFLYDYRPTPIVAPWNGRGGFLEGDDEDESTRAGAMMIQTFRDSRSSRLSNYCETIETISKNPTTKELNKMRGDRKRLEREEKELIAKLKKKGLSDKESERLKTVTEQIKTQKGQEKNLKAMQLHSIRSSVPDVVLQWMDACIVLTGGVDSKPDMPPLLGTGGVDGSQDFSVNFMQRITSVMSPEDGKPTDTAKIWLNCSLFSEAVCGLVKDTIGQFYPFGAGGVNAISGFESFSLLNPWDYLFTMEGALLFASTVIRNLGYTGPGVMSSPFTVNQSGVGYGSATQLDEENSRAEIWMPLWDRPTGLYELKVILSEGRAQVRGRFARNGVDFARAVASLGVDRGIKEFQRYGLLKRNGRAYFATPLGRFHVTRQPQVDLLSDIDRWLGAFNRKVASDKAPASAGRALRQLEEAILSLCKERGPVRVQDVLIALGECERVLMKSNKWANDKKSPLSPIPPLSSGWLKEADDGSPEFRLAASLASVYGQYRNKKGQKVWMSIRAQLEPIRTWIKDGGLGVSWNDDGIADVVWSDGDSVRALNAVMARRIMRAVQSGADTYPDKGRLNAEIGDIADFIEGRVDLQRMADLLWGLMLLDWLKVTKDVLTMRNRSDTVFPGAGYGLMKLCFPGGEVKGVKIPLVLEIHRRASLGDSAGATQLAVRRLRGSGLSVPVEKVDLARGLAQQTAAALIFPVDDFRLSQIAERVLRQKVENKTKEE